MHAVYCINWTEFERGWSHRPDGHTLHVSKEVADTYRANFLACQPETVPHEYSKPGDPFLVEVPRDVFDRLQFKGTIWGHPRQQMPIPSPALTTEGA